MKELKEKDLNVSYKTIIYSTELSALQNTLVNVLKVKKIKFIRLRPTVKTHTIRKGPCGRGYAVFIKKKLKVHKWVLFFQNMADLKKVSSLLTNPSLYIESSLC